MEMVLKFHGKIHKLCIALRKVFLKLGNRLRCTNACNNILALCVDQVFAKNALCACGGVTCEGNACTGGLSLVSEYHGLYVYSSTPVARNIVHTTVYDCTGVVPGTEYSLNRAHQLILRLLRELFAVHSLFVNCLKL